MAVLIGLPFPTRFRFVIGTGSAFQAGGHVATAGGLPVLFALASDYKTAAS